MKAEEDEMEEDETKEAPKAEQDVQPQNDGEGQINAEMLD